jgi:glutaredoxin
MRLLRIKISTPLLLLVTLVLGLSGRTNPVEEQVSTSGQPVIIYLFWGDGCPHCAAAKEFLTGLVNRYSSVEVKPYEVWNEPQNQEIFKKMAAAFNFEPQGVPAIFIGNRYWIGYSDQIGEEIEAYVKNCAENGCADRGHEAIHAIDLPLIGSIPLTGKSLWVSTVLISFVDGVNPCSLWVLTMLLAITLHTGSRKKVLIIGLIFLTVTAGIYGLFIAGLFTALKLAQFMVWIQVIVALVAIFFALVNIKDYFWYKEGISLTISDAKKPGIYQRMRKLVDANQSFWGITGATVLLAVGVSLVEFSCTAGFPVLWTSLLVSQKVTPPIFVFLLLLYLLIYQLDEAVIFLTAVVTLKSSKLEEKHGRILKLIGGMFMLTLAVVMLIKPTLMNNIGSSLLIFGLALFATLTVLMIHRVILPKLWKRYRSHSFKKVPKS